MAQIEFFSRRLAEIATITFLIFATACTSSADDKATVPPAATQGGLIGQTRSVSKLGDLSQFQRIAVDVNALIDKNDLQTAKARIKLLETEWDSAEAGLKPRDAAAWHVLDKAIDQVLFALRADTPLQANCKTAMSELLITLGSFQTMN
jgi:hypothetical protein